MSEFEVIICKDGSPTLAPIVEGEEASGEAMHNIEGAISETEFCYAEPWRQVAQQGGESLLVVGLGLAAIEMLSLSNPPAQMLSFEADPDLRQACEAWLAGETSGLAGAYQIMAESAAKLLSKSASEIRQELSAMHASGAWLIAGELGLASIPDQRFNMIAFDAYSEATSPELWDEAFLAAFLDRACYDKALLSTYAAKGKLKRALQAAGFAVQRRSGFAGKRHSTIATRGFVYEVA